MTDEVKPTVPPDPSIERVIEALKNGRKMDAIMIYRSTHDVSLAESQKTVEEMEKELGL
jgi:hypothetical protein